MSKEDNVRAAALSLVSADTSDDELWLQIDLRLRLDEIAKLEGEKLRSAPRPAPSKRELCRLACWIYDARRTRDRVFDQKLFGEPAWDMLLALYCLPSRGELLTVTSLTLAANVPMTTGHRCQSVLTEQGLIERGPKSVDARKQFIRLTKLGRDLLETYLTRLYYYDAPPPPWAQPAGG